MASALCPTPWKFQNISAQVRRAGRSDGRLGVQFLVLCPLVQVSVEEGEKPLHLRIEKLVWGVNWPGQSQGGYLRASKRTFFCCGSSTCLISLLSSLRISLAATPVVALLKSYIAQGGPDGGDQICWKLELFAKSSTHHRGVAAGPGGLDRPDGRRYAQQILCAHGWMDGVDGGMGVGCWVVIDVHVVGADLFIHFGQFSIWSKSRCDMREQCWQRRNRRRSTYVMERAKVHT